MEHFFSHIFCIWDFAIEKKNAIMTHTVFPVVSEDDDRKLFS